MEIPGGETVLAAAQKAGILLNATCGGEGSCGRCVVRVMAGAAPAPTLVEEAELGRERLAGGWRLACQTEVQADLRVHIPPESLVTALRTQTEGRTLAVQADPAARAVQISLPPPTLDDLRSDAARLRDALGMPGLDVPLPVLQALSTDLRENGYRCTVLLNGSRIAGIRPAETAALGLAVDLGTTKVAAYLVDLASGATLASAGAMNPQIAFGEDVMARLAHAIHKAEGGAQLRAVILEALNGMTSALCAQAGASPADIAEAVIVGNTAMHHLCLGLPVRQLGLAPYVPAESRMMEVPAGEAGLDLASGAKVTWLPNLAGFVGADHIAMLLGSGMLEREGVLLGMDIGTNTEISLIANGRHHTCSTASGPAFEGAHIRYGMRAAPGAIERVLIRGDEVRVQTIDNAPPVGLCGSGILDLVAQMRRAGVLTPRGAFDPACGHARMRKGEHGLEFVVSPRGEISGTDITFDRKDVNEIQLAKGAMRAGVNILLRRAGINEKDIDAVFLAGAFGTYLDVQSGIDIGMFPRVDRERYVQVGNAAGTGARMALVSTIKRQQAADLARHITYVELTAEKDFPAIFAKALMLE